MSVNECHSHTEIHDLFSYSFFTSSFLFFFVTVCRPLGLPAFSHQNMTFNAKCSYRIWHPELATKSGQSGVPAKCWVKWLGHLIYTIVSAHFCSCCPVGVKQRFSPHSNLNNQPLDKMIRNTSRPKNKWPETTSRLSLKEWEIRNAKDKMHNRGESIFSPQVCCSLNNPVSWNGSWPQTRLM